MATGTPKWNYFLRTVWGSPYEFPGEVAFLSNASNVIVGTNPPYTIQDFLGFYPKWGGSPLIQTAATISGQPQIVPSDTSSMSPGNPVAGAGIPDGSIIVSVNTFGGIEAFNVGSSGGSGYVVGDILTPVQDGSFGGELVVSEVDGSGAILAFESDPDNQGIGYSIGTDLPTTGGSGFGALVSITTVGPSITISQNATATADEMQLTVWNAPLVPFMLIMAYINLASASLVQARWQDTWAFGMALYVAHFLTLYAESDGNPNSTITQAAASGLATGVLVSEAAGDVSDSFQPVQGLESWAAWNLTTYGQQLATFSKAIGSGPMLLL